MGRRYPRPRAGPGGVPARERGGVRDRRGRRLGRRCGRRHDARAEPPARARRVGPDDRLRPRARHDRRALRRVPRPALSRRAAPAERWALMATADLTVLALGRPEVSASAYIAAIQRRLAAQDRVRYRMHAMGTSLEGSTADILAVVGELHAVPFDQGVPRVYTILKLDERRDRPDQTLDDKVRAVDERLTAEQPTEPGP